MGRSCISSRRDLTRFARRCRRHRFDRPASGRLRRKPVNNIRHRHIPVLWIGLQHQFDHRADGRIYVGDIGNAAAFLDDLDLRAIHVDGRAAKHVHHHQTEAVYVCRFGNVAVEQSELLGRDEIIFARKLAIQKRHAFRRAGNAEIDDLGVARVSTGENDIVARNVTVDDAELVRGIKTGDGPDEGDLGFL